MFAIRSGTGRLALPICVYALPAVALTGCIDDPAHVSAQPQALRRPSVAVGKQHFEQPLPDTNGRSCATCHVLDEATTLRPESVSKRLRDKPDDPLFNRLDADDADAAELTYAHL